MLKLIKEELARKPSLKRKLLFSVLHNMRVVLNQYSPHSLYFNTFDYQLPPPPPPEPPPEEPLDEELPLDPLELLEELVMVDTIDECIVEKLLLSESLKVVELNVFEWLLPYQLGGVMARSLKWADHLELRSNTIA